MQEFTPMLAAAKSSTPAGRLRWVQESGRKIFVVALASWLVLVSAVVLLLAWKNPEQRAVVGMGWGVIVLWIGVGGLTMWWGRDLWCRAAARLRMPWGLKFVLGCVALALVEEAVTTLLTNCAPLFGVPLGHAYITASANYLDVVLYHSVVVFVPMFIGWAILLRWWRFSPFDVFLLFGFTGTFIESMTFGWQNLASFAFWIFVYGLMVWLPAQWVPGDRPARAPRWWAYPVAMVMPIAFVPLVAILAPWLWLTPKHPPVHFH